MTDRRDLFLVQIPAWLLLLYLVYAQGPAAFDYEIGIRMGTQEPAESITEIGVAFWHGFAFADLVIYIPLLAAGLIAYRLGTRWGRALLAAALGITVYWPVVVLAAAVNARDAAGWTIEETPYWIVLPVILIWALFALFQVARTSTRS